MKLWHKILWAVAGVIPFGLWGIAFMCNDFTWAFNLITISCYWIMLYGIAQLIILFMWGKRKYGIKKTFWQVVLSLPVCSVCICCSS